MGSDRPRLVISGQWHPPGSSRAEAARFTSADGVATAKGAEGGETLAEGAVSGLSVSNRVGRIPRRITFADGSVFETDDNDAIDRWLKAHRGWRVGFVHGLERFHPRLILLVAVVAVLCVGLYRYALPIAVEVAVAVTPPAAPRLMGQSALASLDQTVLAPSQLEGQRRQAITSDFRTLAELTPGGADAFDLQFRRGGVIGPNAFALPDGTIVLTDELVRLARDEDAVLGVLAHEIGHVVHKHSLRRLYRAAGITTLIMFIGGDIGSGMEEVLVQGAGLMTLSYSRDQESEADRYSVELMAKAGREPAGLARLFDVLRENYGDDDRNDFFSTHPTTPDRIEDIRRHAAEVGAR
ncbi:M48 family metallopeptidase [Chelativorans salis]|uniref:M48 family metallopeptidase n=1 Tax=Chelativorans salis TaxID=2978478 RepID=A0ABT2LJD1_9HYPH|nr:M48 family metallopeptidase [Chelativorans sp. EGI FJ00035]MCT7373798.1 M48 family metallopeptidase [Chelativorans sp. EGI FJ00035]